ncbi:MAG: WD40 repeat domain-containing protein, partial [Limisphaerales bacterium]
SRQILSSATDRTIRLWDLGTGSELWAVTNTGVSTRDFAFSPDGTLVASAETDSMIRFRRISDGTVAQSLTNSATVRVLAFSPDNRTLLSANDDHTLRV